MKELWPEFRRATWLERTLARLLGRRIITCDRSVTKDRHVTVTTYQWHKKLYVHKIKEA